MNWQNKLKEAGVSIHVVATGAGAGLQAHLWETPGSSAYLSGASFPYSSEEQEELLGFMPEHFCSKEAAIDLASAAYMKAYKFGGKKPVGIGIAASVASETLHRGDHHMFGCVITNDKVLVSSVTFTKGVGIGVRQADGENCDLVGRFLLMEALGIENNLTAKYLIENVQDATQLAKDRFYLRPFFATNGKRFDQLPQSKNWALMPGAFNPPHEGHFGMAAAAFEQYSRRVVFETTAEPPHKAAMSVQELLQRAKLLQGYDRIFTVKEAYYIDKARKFPNMPIVMGADACLRMFDPKWKLNIPAMLDEFGQLGTNFLVASRTMDGNFLCVDDVSEVVARYFSDEDSEYYLNMFLDLGGEWNISSTEIRNKLL